MKKILGILYNSPYPLPYRLVDIMKPIGINGGIKIGYSITLKPKGKRKKDNPYEAQLENLRWKLKFHEEQVEEIKEQIKMLEEYE